jgi:hypothetical protein
MLAARAGEAANVIEGTAEPLALPAPEGSVLRSRCKHATAWQKFVPARNHFITVSVFSSKLTASKTMVFAIGWPLPAWRRDA